MKYGQRLGKQSVPEWHSHNILYDDLKHQIKLLTASASAFSRKDYEALVEFFKNEIENTNLFVHCKLGEIDYRFQQCDYIVRDLSQAPHDERLYHQLSSEVSRLNQDIRNLSRFIVAQYTGFRKLLKKYRRHAPREQLVEKNRNLDPVDDMLMSRNSFARVDLTPQFLELSVLYSTLRTRQFGQLFSSSRHTHVHKNKRKHTGNDDDDGGGGGGGDDDDDDDDDDDCAQTLAQFDVEMLTVLASNVYRFWVHPDNLVQLKVLLLQNLDLVRSQDADEEDHEITTIMYMDTGDLQSARELGEPAQVRQVELGGGGSAGGLSQHSRPVLLVPAGGLRHTAAVELTDDQYNSLKRGHSNAPSIAAASPSNTDVGGQLALGWVSSQSARPVTTLKSHRARFRSEGDRVWASIDTDTTITDPQVTAANSRFPYSVLEIRAKRDLPWIDALRQSHLLYPVSASFSLYAWALLRTHPQQVAVRPKWLDQLDADTDIRREPSEVNLNYNLNTRKSVASLQLHHHHNGEITPGDSSTSPTPPPQQQPPTPPTPPQPPMTRYWNEFDDGDEYEDGDGFFEEIDEELRRARIAANLARPVYQLGESMRRQFNTWFDHGKRYSPTSGSESFGTPSITSIDSAQENSSLLRHQHSRQYSPRIGARSAHGDGAVSYYGTMGGNDDLADLENATVQHRNDQGLALITFLCFCLSLSIVALVFTILFTEDVLLLPSGLRASLVMFLVIALALALLGHVAFSFRSTQNWGAHVLVHIVLLTVVCFGVGGIANIAMPQL